MPSSVDPIEYAATLQARSQEVHRMMKLKKSMLILKHEKKALDPIVQCLQNEHLWDIDVSKYKLKN